MSAEHDALSGLSHKFTCIGNSGENCHTKHDSVNTKSQDGDISQHEQLQEQANVVSQPLKCSERNILENDKAHSESCCYNEDSDCLQTTQSKQFLDPNGSSDYDHLKCVSSCSVSQLSPVIFQEAVMDNAMPQSKSCDQKLSTLSLPGLAGVDHGEYESSSENGRDSRNGLLSNNHTTTVDISDYQWRHTNVPRTRIQHPVEKSAMISLIVALCSAIVSLVLFGPFIVILLVILPMGLLIKGASEYLCFCGPQPHCIGFTDNETVSYSDMFWLMENPVNKPLMQSVVLLQGHVEVDKLRKLMMDRVITPHYQDKGYRRLTQKLIPLFANYAWVRDASFNIKNHVYAIPKIAGKGHLEKYLAEMSSKEFDSSHPLWELQLWTKFDSDDQTLLILRFHPCVIDGLSLLTLLCNELTESTSDFCLYYQRPHMATPLFAINAFRAFFSGSLIFLQHLFSGQDMNYLSTQKLSGVKCIAVSQSISLPQITRIKHVTRCPLTEVLLSALAGALRLYLQSLGADNPGDIQAVIPINLHSSVKNVKSKNKSVLLPVLLPVNTEGAIPRLWELKLRLDELRNASDAVALYGAWNILMGILPYRTCRAIWRMFHNKSTCLITNLPGPVHSLSTNSLPVRSILHSMSPVDDIGFSVSFSSYAEELLMSVVADKNVIPDPCKLTSLFCQQLEQMADILANRRIPGEITTRYNLDLSLENTDNPEVLEMQLRFNDIQKRLQDVKHKLIAISNGDSDDDEEVLSLQFRALRNEFHTVVAHLHHLQSVNRQQQAASEEEASASGDKHLEEETGLCRSTARPLTTVCNALHSPILTQLTQDDQANISKRFSTHKPSSPVDMTYSPAVERRDNAKVLPKL